MTQLSPQEAFALAVQHHQAGRLRDAEQVYRQILAQHPGHPAVLYHLGVLALQAGQVDQAISTLRQAIAHRPDFTEALCALGNALQDAHRPEEAIGAWQQVIALRPDLAEAHSNLGNLLRDAGRNEEALAAYRQAVALKPDLAEAHYNLGNALKEQHRLQDAIACYRQVLALKPDFADAHYNLGNALQEVGQFEEALAGYRQAVTLAPGFAEAFGNLGAVLVRMGRLDEAIAACRRALELRPGYPEVLCNLGKAQHAQGSLGDAVTSYRQALVLRRDYAEAHNSLGNALLGLGQLDDAIAAYRQAVACRTDFAEAYNNLGNALTLGGRAEQAIAACRRATTLKPDLVEAHNNLGAALRSAGRLDEAVAILRHAIAGRPDLAEAWNNLGAALAELGQIDEAIGAYRQALAIRPGYVNAHSNLLLVLHDSPGIDAAAIAQEHQRWAQHHATPLQRCIRPHANRPDPERRLRIGYVSADFRRHAVAGFLLPLLANHDHRQLEVFAYSQVVAPDAMTGRLAAHADTWRNLPGLDDAQAAELIRQDQIDILVDLAGHTANHRLRVFARKPAPVQVTYLGYPDTTGLPTMDYRLTDACADPPGQSEAYCCERLYRLSPTAWCFQPGDAVPLPERPEGPITFGSFSNLAKITESMLALWGRILQAVPGSRLLLKAPGLGSASACQRIQRVLDGLGIGSERVQLRGFEQSYAAHMMLYGRIDIALDSFPYHGTGTTCEALWMGVPMVSLVGQSHVSRVGVSLLSNVGLRELLAETPEQYVQIAVALAGDRARLRELHATLRPRMEHSPLMDAAAFARGVEGAYRQMWRSWCRGEGH